MEFSPDDATDRFRLAPARAFWLISREAHRVDTAPVPGLSLPTGREYPIVLERGWNAIANPFDFRVAWASVRKPDSISAPVAFDPARGAIGDYADAPAALLEPFEGYFIKNESSQPETLWVPPVEAPIVGPEGEAGGARPASVAPGRVPQLVRSDAERSDAWRMRLRASSSEALDGANLLGVEPGARDGYDALDQPKPPMPPGEWVRVSFVHPEWEARAGPYRHDVRAAGAEGHAWELEVLSAKVGEPIALELVDEGALPPEMAVGLIDREQGSVVELRAPGGALASYRLLSPGPERAYRLALLAGSAEYVGRAAREVPTQAVLDQNAPNPFSGLTRMRFGLARGGVVRLDVFNLLGERVATPLGEGRLPAGYHTVLWDGRNDAGGPAPSGVYFFRLTAPERVLTRRLVLVR